MRHHTPRTLIRIICLFSVVTAGGVMITAAPPAAGVGPSPPPGKIGAVPGRRVLADFRTVYRQPDGTTERRVTYAGGVRNGSVIKGGITVPSQVHRVTVDVIITECGLPLRDIWDAHYYRLETEWIFDRIEKTGSREVGAPKKKLPALDDEKALSLIRQGLGERRPGWVVKEVVVLRKTASRERCTARALVTTRALFSRADDLTNTLSTYECLMRSTLEISDGEWRYAGDSCVFRGKDRVDCFIPTMCRSLPATGSLPEVNDAEALQLLKKSLEMEYGLRKGNVDIETLEIISRGEPEQYRTKIPLTGRVLFSIDERGESVSDGKPGLVSSRVVYECVVRAFLVYSRERAGWDVSLDSCCSDENVSCGYSCSQPGKGCTRIGEK